MKFKQELPENVESKLSAYIDRIKQIKWFQPAKDLKKEVVEKNVNLVLEAFGVKAGIGYRLLKTPGDWGAAWDAAQDAAWDAAWVAAQGADDLLVEDLPTYKEKYPKGSFINLVPLYEMGLYPIGVVDGKFIVAIPASKLEFPDEFSE